MLKRLKFFEFLQNFDAIFYPRFSVTTYTFHLKKFDKHSHSECLMRELLYLWFAFANEFTLYA